MKLEYYLIACSIIAISLMRVHSYVNERYSGVDFYQQQSQVAQEETERIQVLQAKRDYENKVFQQQVAAYLPNLKKENAYVARNIASVISQDSIVLEKDTFSPAFQEAKAHFTDGNFVSAGSILEKLKAEFSSHPQAAEVTYLLMEAYHQEGRVAEAIDQIELMLQLYPESNLAGYALIRLGDYYQQEDDKDKAAYCYNYAIENFSYDKNIVQVATQKMGSL